MADLDALLGECDTLYQNFTEACRIAHSLHRGTNTANDPELAPAIADKAVWSARYALLESTQRCIQEARRK